ncbi:SIS domain-containing protein [Tenacibaculum retecalamus]|uniref:SIS domain-containing protein n=1 Tax=Tenacibaculum retecalamus TaxID=3018315 RepID=UPI0023D962ED|nr:SIS domain-containing protein [Tenacibaculum retecalamus]WBX71664.1 SIS domain-containing protein [Tenacibaculum retecalamus]
MILDNLNEHILVLKLTVNQHKDDIILIANECITRLKTGGKIIILGNGGSAADAQHMAAELVGSFNNKQRKALAAIALTTDTSILTSISNDYTYDNVFSRQIEALATDQDLVIGISTSGTSKNVINALKVAKNKKCFVVGLSGNKGGDMNTICDKNIIVNSTQTSRIQEVHLFIEHSICDIIDRYFLN